MNAAPGVETVQIRWTDEAGWTYIHTDRNGGVIGASTDRFPELHGSRFSTPADRSSLIHEAQQVWPNAHIVDVSTNQS